MTDGPPDDVASPARRSARNALEWVAIVVGALVVALVVKTFLIQAFYIPSLSMYSTLDKGDRVLVNKLSYHLHDVHRGDIVVFKRPKGLADSDIKDLIKRVVALPGETIEARDGAVIINGKPLTEKYLRPATKTTDCSNRAPGFGPEVVPKGEIFVMGDNRSDSQDSRCFGPIGENLIVGRAFIRVWPLQDFHLL